MKSNPARFLALLLLGVTSGAAPEASQSSGSVENVVHDPAALKALKYRMIGPHKGSRVTAVTGIAEQPWTYFMGTNGGGLWKTTDAGESWMNVSDGYYTSSSIGAIDVADSDPSIVYVGTGSACIRGNVSPGDGIYKSTDGGESWTHLGLHDAGQIGRLVIHPENPDVAYAAVLGHAFGPNEMRGVFRTTDGGASWEKVLYVSERTGANDIAMDASNPECALRHDVDWGEKALDHDLGQRRGRHLQDHRRRGHLGAARRTDYPPG